MNTEKENLSAQQSLDLISQMIMQAQGSVLNNSFYFLLWGWVVTLCNFGMYGLMKFTSYPHPYIVWLLSIPAWVVSMIYGMRQGKRAVIHTHLEKITMWMWIFLGLSILPIVFFGYKINYQINPITLILLSAPTFLAGIILKFRALVFGGISFYCFGIAAFAVDFETQYLLGGVAMIIGNLIPGYMLKAQKR